METSEDHPETQKNAASRVALFGVAASLLVVFSACGGIIGGYGQISIGNANGWWLLVGDQNDPSYSTYGYVLVPLMIASVVLMVISMFRLEPQISSHAGTVFLQMSFRSGASDDTGKGGQDQLPE